MIQVGKPSMIGVTFGQAGLIVAARVFDGSGPVSAWMLMYNFDGGSYNLPYTFPTPGAYSIKKVVFQDGGFTARDGDYAEADDAVQVFDMGALLVDQTLAGHTSAGTVGAALQGSAASSSSQGALEGVLELEEVLTGISEDETTLVGEVI